MIISKQNVAISDINQPLSLAISGVGTYSVSVLNYLAAAEASGSANLRALARGLFTYAGEAMELLS